MPCSRRWRHPGNCPIRHAGPNGISPSLLLLSFGYQSLPDSVKGGHTHTTCVVYGKRSDAGTALEAACTVDDARRGRAALDSSKRRWAMCEGRGWCSPARILSSRALREGLNCAESLGPVRVATISGEQSICLARRVRL